jgi:hypothetical protein
MWEAIMTDAGYYRREAERFAQLAETTRGPEAGRHWWALARDCHALADDLEGVPQIPVTEPTQH